MKKLIFTSLLLGVIFLTGCGLQVKNQETKYKDVRENNISDNSGSSNNDNNNTEKTNPETKITEVEIKNYSFSPKELVIKKGDTVIWKNSDSVSHSVVFESFKSESLLINQSFSYVFNEVGTYEYYCLPHLSMKGSIIVE